MACFGAEAGTKAGAMSWTGLFIHTEIMAWNFARTWTDYNGLPLSALCITFSNCTTF